MRKHVAIAAIILLSTVAAHAQVSVYVTDSSIHLSNVATGIPFVPGFVSQQQYTSYWASGVGGGVTFDFLPLPIFSLGLDLRGSTKPGTVGADYAMVGLKLGMHPPVLRIKPYVQASAGYLGTRTFSTSVPVGSTNNGTYITWEILGGIDFPLMHFIDLRAIELGGGQGIDTGSGSNASLFTVNTGLVAHF
ncbi:MAG: hypothetical protein ACLQM6_09620 [Acidobacteriaceae bacterium]